MSFTIDQLLTPQTAAQWRATMVASMVALGVPADKWRAGGVASTMLTVVSITLSLLSGVLSSVIGGFFLPSASGGGLILLAKYVYGVIAPTATFATGDLTLTNSGGGVYTIAAGALTALNPSTKQTYVNTTAFVLSALTTLTIPIRAAVAGTIGNANPRAITTLVTSLLGVTCSNATSLVGTDALSDPALRQLCVDSIGATSVYGPRSAYAYAIQTASNPVTGAAVNINRWTISRASSTGTVTIVVASPTGVPDSQDIIGVGVNIEARARPDTVTVSLSGATGVAYSNALTVWCTTPAGVSAANVQTAVATALTNLISTYPPGGQTANDDSHPAGFTGLFADAIKGAVGAGVNSVGGQLYSVQGATDLALTSTQVATDSIPAPTIQLLNPATGTVIS